MECSRIVPKPTPTARIRGNIVLHETGPWRQKGWGWLVQPIAHLGYTVYPTAPGLQTCVAGYCSEPRQSESSTWECDTINRLSTRDVGSSCRGDPAYCLQQALVLYVEITIKITIKSIVECGRKKGHILHPTAAQGGLRNPETESNLTGWSEGKTA